MEGEQIPRYWFRAKTYGYGWYPATWQGFAVLVVYFALIGVSSWKILSGADVGIAGVRRFLTTVGILTFFLVYVCYTHGERPRWRWGKEEDAYGTHIDDHR